MTFAAFFWEGLRTQILLRSFEIKYAAERRRKERKTRDMISNIVRFSLFFAFKDLSLLITHSTTFLTLFWGRSVVTFTY